MFSITHNTKRRKIISTYMWEKRENRKNLPLCMRDKNRRSRNRKTQYSIQSLFFIPPSFLPTSSIPLTSIPRLSLPLPFLSIRLSLSFVYQNEKIVPSLFSYFIFFPPNTLLSSSLYFPLLVD
uniref:Uncharacterized protein n=1 Tax=Cacopsylla melanoneura TaxID=428564 RepID=A0A8D8ZD13_9HEMI